MKKKMLFMAALAGVVTLGSCVKDDVSGSVEAVRNAKANQLNADANLKNAQAAYQNALTAAKNAISAAEVAYQQAQAAYENARARHEEADAEDQELKNKLAADEYAAQLEAAIANFSYLTARDQARAQDELNNLATYLATKDTNLYKRVQGLISQYQGAYDNWIAAQNTVLVKEADLEIAKIDAEKASALRAKESLATKNKLEVAKAVLDYIVEQGQKGQTSEEVQAQLTILDQKIAALQLEYQNSAELPAFVKTSNAISKPYSDWYKANAKISSDLAVLADAALANTSAFATKLFTAPAKKGGIDAVWDNIYDDQDLEAASGTKRYISYVYLGAKKGEPATITPPAPAKVYSEIEKIADPTNPLATLTVNFDGKFDDYAIAKADDIKAIKAELKKDSTAFEAAYATALVTAGIGAPTDPANPTGSLYAKLAQAKLDESTASANYTIAKATLDNDLLILAAEGSAPTPGTLAKVDADYTAIYGPATVPASVPATDVAKWKASAASIAYRPNNAAGMRDFDLTKAKGAVKTAQENLDTAIAALTTGVPSSPGPGDTRNAGLAKVANAKKIIDGAAEDLAAYKKAADALIAAEEAYNKDAKALMDIVNVAAKKMNAEKVALEAIYTQTYEVALANQKATVATLEKDLADWDSVNPVWVDKNSDTIQDPDELYYNPEQVIRLAEQALEKAKMEVDERKAELLAAQKALEESGIEFDFDDKPAPAPAEDETPAPAEDETPAEGGESEGGESEGE